MATVVNKGLEMIAKLIGGVSTDKMQYVALVPALQTRQTIKQL